MKFCNLSHADGLLGKKDEEVFVDLNDPMKFFTESNKTREDVIGLTYAVRRGAWLVFEGLKATQDAC